MGSSLPTTRSEALWAGRPAHGHGARDGTMYPDGYGAGYRFHFPRWTPTVRRVIIATVAIFLVQFFLQAFRVVNLAAYLGVRADRVVLHAWVWTIVTYMFLHGGVFHILFNMLALYFFGTQMEGVLGRRRFLVLYFGGGVVGGLAYVALQVFTSNFFAQPCVPAIGASAAVMAVLVLCAIYFPNQLVFFFFVPIPMKWLVTLLVAVDLLYSITAYKDGVAHIAHLGGAAFGYLFWRLSPVVKRWLDRVEDRRRERDAQRRVDDERRMDELLAKIGREGFQSLSVRERFELDAIRRRRQDRGYRD